MVESLLLLRPEVPSAEKGAVGGRRRILPALVPLPELTLALWLELFSISFVMFMVVFD